MAYKDENKRKQAQRERTRRYREKHKGVTKQNVTSIGAVTPSPPVGIITPEGPRPAVPPNYGKPNCLCLHCVQVKGKCIINHGAYKARAELGVNEVNRITMEQDVDYKEAVC